MKTIAVVGGIPAERDDVAHGEPGRGFLDLLRGGS
jgi:hypothetical protein